MQRKSFLTKLSAAAASIMSFSSFQTQPSKKELKNCFIHHVYFWLKNPDSKADRDQLVAGLKKLSTVKTIQQFHIGKPAATRRDVIESSYAVSWFTMFANAADEERYQTDPIHLKFIEECSHVWSKVVVYDSVDV
ncbi:MAG TPA: Dabb family protein [Lacibacter sp.]|nr:Dabb family protein [Lacibacter sp.]